MFSEYTVLLINPDQFANDVFGKLEALGDAMTKDDSSQLALFFLELYKNDTPRYKAEEEMADMLGNAHEFTNWVYDRLDKEREAIAAASNPKKRAAPEPEPEQQEVQKAAKEFKVQKIVWDAPEQWKPAAAKPLSPLQPPAKKEALDLEEQKRLRMARFGIVEQPAPVAVPTPAHQQKPSVGIFGRGTSNACSSGIQSRIGSGIASRLGPQSGFVLESSGSAKSDDGHQRIQYHQPQQQLQHQQNQVNGSRPEIQILDNESPYQQQQNQFQQGNFQSAFNSNQQQQNWNNNRNNNSNNNGFRQSNLNNNSRFQNVINFQTGQNNFQPSGAHQLQQGLMIPAGFFMDAYGNLVPTMNVQEQQFGATRGSFGMQQRGRGAFGYNKNRGGSGGSMSSGFRGNSSFGARPPFNDHEHRLPLNPNPASNPEDPAAASGGEESVQHGTAASIAESEDGGAEIVMDAAPTTVAPPLTSAPSSFIQQPAPCRFGAACTRYDCIFWHPWNQEQAAVGGVILPGMRQCRFWPNCINATCTFFHPTVSGSAPTERTDISQVPCRFDGFCTKPGCPFKHAVGQQLAGNKSTVFNGAGKTHVSERVFVAEEAEKVFGEGVVEAGTEAARSVTVVAPVEKESVITSVVVGDDEELIDEDALL
ncbi:UNVERIFIED_CONTAM: hypothetical protein HDU68_011801 [Siphonaria sp. JEL0065]|nr:hypothetical protein HDU68_011801 [Siphonaria sp. JEL0065]